MANKIVPLDSGALDGIAAASDAGGGVAAACACVAGCLTLLCRRRGKRYRRKAAGKLASCKARWPRTYAFLAAAHETLACSLYFYDVRSASPSRCVILCSAVVVLESTFP